jgi:PAS domain S-box-containing protein
VARFRRLFDQSPVGVAMTTPDCDFLRVNEALCRITGYSEAKLLTLNCEDITHPDDLALTRDYAQKLAAGQIEQYTIDKRYIRKNGSIAWVNVSVRSVRDETGQPQYFLPVMVDITERKQAEEALRLSEARLRALIDNIPFSVWMRDCEGQMILQNPVDIEQWGDIRGKSVQESELPAEVARRWASLNKEIVAGKIMRKESQYLVKGKPRFFESIAAPIWIGDEVSGIVGISIDITERKQQAESKLAESEARYRAIVEDQTELVCRSTADGCLTFVNKAYARYFGKEPEELILASTNSSLKRIEPLPRLRLPPIPSISRLIRMNIGW